MPSESSKPSLTIVREYQHPPQKVWDAWTSIEALKQ